VSVSAWDINRGQRIASAEMPGHLLHATWSAYGMKLAIVRLNDHTSRSGKLQFPWESRSSSPFMLHVWDMRIVGRARSSVMEENPQ
jgi:hypothetical protein